MVKSSKERADKYKAKVKSNVIGERYDKTKDLAVEGEGRYFKEAVAVEEGVKALLHDVGSMLINYYIIFAKEILSVLRSHTGQTAQDEICILCQKWYQRGLAPINLNKISELYVGMACFDIGDIFGLPWTGQTTVYQAGDDATYQRGTTTDRPIVKGVGSHRFTDNGDGTITDEGTGLMWVKDPVNNPGAPFNAIMTWANAIINCEALNFAGHTDWRLPNIKELMSIVDYDATAPCIDGTFFPNTVSGNYWSSTTLDAISMGAWHVFFSGGDVGSGMKTNTIWVRPVRLGKPE